VFLLAAAVIAAISVPAVQSAPPIDGVLHDQWKDAASVSLAWDLQGHKPAADPTTAYIESDGTYLYVAFDAKQREAIVATQHTDDAGEGADDEVTVNLWPGGMNGFRYSFSANPIGTHYQSSSENSNYRPQWWSAGSVNGGEYVVTMKIPLSALHGASSQTWRAQFSRKVEATGDVDVWSYDANQTSPTDTLYAGTLTGLHAAAVRPLARAELYNLGSIAGISAGGNTARTGLDFSIPFTATSSFYGTVHPDYSNVEKDQQSISPTAFRRFFSEVRPFFTQGNAAYNNFDCDMCNGIMSLYTPSIPTPRRGFAVEGKQGPFTYGSYDAAGDARSDAAQALSWRNAPRTFGVSFQRVSMNQPGFADDTVELGTTFGDAKRFSGYFNYGIDKGTNVLDAKRAQYYDFGSGYFTPTTALGFAVRKEGEYYNPADGFVWHPDTAGWGGFFSHAWLYANGSPVRSITIESGHSAYHDRTGELNDTSDGITLDVLTRGLIDVNVSTGSSYVRFSPGAAFYPVTQNGVFVTFGSGAENSSVNNGAQHGASATPTTIGFSTGRFGPGRLNAATLSSTVRASSRGLLSLELDQNSQLLDAGGRNVEWLERVSYTFQQSREASFALGVRHIIGQALFIDGPQYFPTGWNLSAAYHRTFGEGNELYAVYGDASQVQTVPAFIVKWIHYFGGGKGT
jgi:hypothetical protein